jgi:hypothetical protein
VTKSESVVLCVVLSVAGLGSAAAGAADEPAEGLTPILSMDSYWRWHVTLRPPAGLKAGRLVDHLSSDPPPGDWTATDYQDGDWPRSRLAWLRGLVSMRYSSAVLRLRGRFAVTDPSAVGRLRLVCRVSGNAAVYLNGRQVAADAGSGPVQLPLDALRRGVNCLAVEVRRGDFRPARPRRNRDPGRTSIDVHEMQLAAASRGIVPNVGRPRGLQVWNHDRNDRVTERDWGAPNEPLRPVRIVAARNGSYCGQLVVACTDPIRDLAVTAEPLRAAGGGRIAAGAVDFLFARPDASAYKYFSWFDGLQRDPPKVAPVLCVRRWQRPDIPDAAMVPILVRVRVPKDAAAGQYTGRLRITMRGQAAVTVPLELHVAGWTLPDPADYRTYVGIYQSPTSLAMQYGVPEWSEAHWRLMDRSFALLARAGNRLVNVHIAEQTQFGNDRGMVYWVKQPDGAFAHDFSVFDRFVEMAKRHFKKLDHVAIHVWHSGGWQVRSADQHNTVTVRDPKTGGLGRMQVPAFGTDESKRFWRPVLAAIHERLTKLGLGRAMCLGILSDGTAPPEVFKAFDEIWPGGGPARWMRGLHGHTFVMEPYRLRGGGRVVLHEFCYGLQLHDPTQPLPPIHTYRGRPGAAYHRISGHETAASLIWYRTFGEQSLLRNTKGVGRVCLDFWPVLEDTGRRRRQWIYNRYPHSSCAQRAPSLQKMTWPAPGGAGTTLRYEAFCEGIQEAEAMIYLSEALHEHAAKLGPRLAEACRRVMLDRLNYCRRWDQMKWAHVYYHMHHYGWQELSRRLYDCAAAVAAKIEGT